VPSLDGGQCALKASDEHTVNEGVAAFIVIFDIERHLPGISRGSRAALSDHQRLQLEHCAAVSHPIADGRRKVGDLWRDLGKRGCAVTNIGAVLWDGGDII